MATWAERKKMQSTASTWQERKTAALAPLVNAGNARAEAKRAEINNTEAVKAVREQTQKVNDASAQIRAAAAELYRKKLEREAAQKALPSLADINKVTDADRAEIAANSKPNPYRDMNLARDARRAGAKTIGVGLGGGTVYAGNAIVNAADFITSDLEGAGNNMFRFVGIRDKAESEKQNAEIEQRKKGVIESRSAKVDDAVTGIEKTAGVNTETMSPAGRAAYNTIQQLPKMLAGSAVFAASALGDYGSKALSEGASVSDSLKMGAAGAATELTLEKVLGVVPGMAGLKKAASAGVKGFVGNVAGEAVEEAATTPVINALKKIIYNPNQKILDENSLSTAGQDALGGAMMAVLMTALGMPAKSLSRRTATRIVESGKETTPQAVSALEGILQAETEVQSEAERALEAREEAVTGRDMPTPTIKTQEPLFNGKLKKAIAEYESLLRHDYGQDSVDGAGYISPNIPKSEAEDLRNLYELRARDPYSQPAQADPIVDKRKPLPKEAFMQTESEQSEAQAPVAEVPVEVKRQTETNQKEDPFIAPSIPETDEGWLDVVDQMKESVRMHGVTPNLQFFGKQYGEKISKALLNTFKKNGLAEEFPELFNEKSFSYDPLTEEVQLEAARKRIAADKAGELDKIDEMTPAQASVEDANVAFELLAENLEALRKDPNDREAFWNVQMLSQKAKDFGIESGRVVQAFAKYSRTVEGVTALSRKLFDSVENALPDTKKGELSDEINAVDVALETADNNAAEDAADEIDDIINEIEEEAPDDNSVEVADADAKRAKAKADAAEKKAREAKDRAQKEIAEAEARKARAYAERAEANAERARANSEARKAETLARKARGQEQREKERLAKALEEVEKGPVYIPGTDRTFAEELGSKIVNHLKDKPKNRPDPIEDMVNELFRKAKESPIKSVNEAANKARDPIQFAIQALDARGLYNQVYNDAIDLVRKKYKNEPDKLKALEDFFADKRTSPVSTATLSSIVRKGMSEVNVTLEQLKSDPKARKDLINHIISQGSVRGEAARSLRAFLEKRMSEMANTLRAVPANKQEPMLSSLFDTALKKEFAPKQAERILTGLVTGTGKARPKTQSNKLSIGQIVRDYQKTGKHTEKQIIDHVIQKTGATGEKAEQIRKLLVAKMKEYRREYQDKYLANLFKERSPKEAQKMLEKVRELDNVGVLRREDVQNLIKEKYGIPNLTPEDIKMIMDGMDRFDKAQTPALKEQAYGEILKRLANKMPRTMMKQVRAWAKTAMLLNPSTHVANLAGNAVNVQMERFSDAISMQLERLITKAQRTKAILTKKDSAILAKAEKDWQDNGEVYLRDTDAYKIRDASGLSRMADPFSDKTALGRAGNATQKLVSDMLKKGDKLTFKPVYVRALAQIMKARGLSEVTPEAQAYALKKASEVTLRAENALAEWYNKAKHLKGGLGATVGFVADTAVPFVNTPMNAATRGVEYSPLGFLVASYKTIRNGQYTPSEVIESWSKAAVGSIGGAGLGAILQLLGIIDYDEKRGLTVGIGDKDYTIDWVQPAAMQLAFGAAAVKLMREKGIPENAVEAFALGGESVLKGFDTIFNMSVLRSVKEIFGSAYGGPGESLASIPAKALMQNIPAPLGALAKTIDPQTRSTYDPNPIVATAKQFATRVPGASMLLPQKIDPLGQPEKNESALGLFVLPGRELPASTGAVADEVRKQGVDLKYAVSKWKVTEKGKERQIVLTARQYEQFAKEVGKERIRLLAKLFANPSYRTKTQDEKADLIKDQISKADSIVKKRWKEGQND